MAVYQYSDMQFAARQAGIFIQFILHLSMMGGNQSKDDVVSMEKYQEF
jgi:hypothetical protein